MLAKAYTIEFRGIYQGREYYFRTYENEYRNLMVLLKDKIYPDDFGQCGGIGRCGTCLVEITGLPHDPGAFGINEQNTLAKMGARDPTARLACQVQIDEDLKDVIVQIFDNN